MKLFLSNLPFALSQEELRELLERYGEVLSVKLIHQRGFDFAEVSGEDWIGHLNGRAVYGREIRVSEVVNSDLYVRPGKADLYLKRKRPRRLRL